MKTRMYDPSIGRFLSPDNNISGNTALAYNPYLYCANNPISRIDPNGKSWWSAIVGAVVGVAIVIAAILEAIPAAIVAAAVVVGGAIAGATVGAYEYYKSNKGNTNWKGYAKAAGNGAVGGVVGAAIGAELVFSTIVVGGMISAGLGVNKISSPSNSISVSEIESNSAARTGGVPQRAIDTMNEVEQNGGPLEGYSSTVYKNVSFPRLPANATYIEHDIYPLMDGVRRGEERLVFGSNGSVNYTPDHYDSWINLK